MQLQFGVRTIILLVTTACLLTGCYRWYLATRDLDYLIKRIDRLIAKQNYDEAEDLAAYAVKLYPEDKKAQAVAWKVRICQDYQRLELVESPPETRATTSPGGEGRSFR